MANWRSKEHEFAEYLRLHRGSPEVGTVLQWLNVLEMQAIEALIDCPAADHADKAARVQILRLLQARITAPTLSESQAQYTGDKHAGAY